LRGLRRLESSATRGRTAVMSLVFVVSRGKPYAMMSPGATSFLVRHGGWNGTTLGHGSKLAGCAVGEESLIYSATLLSRIEMRGAAGVLRTRMIRAAGGQSR